MHTHMPTYSQHCMTHCINMTHAELTQNRRSPMDKRLNVYKNLQPGPVALDSTLLGWLTKPLCEFLFGSNLLFCKATARLHFIISAGFKKSKTIEQLHDLREDYSVTIFSMRMCGSWFRSLFIQSWRPQWTVLNPSNNSVILMNDRNGIFYLVQAEPCLKNLCLQKIPQTLWQEE